MADEPKTYTQEEVDEMVNGLKTKIQEVVGDNKKLQATLRKTQDITPEAHQAEIDAREKADARVKELEGALKTAATERDKAVKALETESGAARSYAIEAEIASGVTGIGVVPALADGFKALHRGQFKADVVDGKYVVTSLDGKPPADYFKEVAGSEAGKSWIGAPANSGGGAPGGRGGANGKALPQATIDAMSPKERSTYFTTDGGTIAPAA